MEPVTHLLTGACLARTGFHRRAAYATAGMAIAAEFPDIDTLWRFRGPVAAFAHHRGITHTFVGIPFEAALLLGGFFLWDRWRQSRRSSAKSVRQAAPVRWIALYGCLLLALLSHLFLDYTNNYGLRPFLPFDSHWYAASLVFIVDPWLLAILCGGLLLPVLLGLVQQEVSGRRNSTASPISAILALLLVVSYWSFRAYEHGIAMHLASSQTLRAPSAAHGDISQPQGPAASGQESTSGDLAGTAPVEQRPLLVPQRSWASPDPISPFQWYVATDYGPVYQTGTADTRAVQLAPVQLLYKPQMTPLLERAESTELGRVYLNWSAMPLLTTANNSDDPSGQLRSGQLVVNFEDLRFLNSTPLLNRGRLPPLTGQVLLTKGGEVVAQGMDGAFNH